MLSAEDFTEAENMRLVELVDHYTQENGYSVNGLSLYQKIAHMFPGKTDRLIREHFRKRLRPQDETIPSSVGDELTRPVAEPVVNDDISSQDRFYTLKPEDINLSVSEEEPKEQDQPNNASNGIQSTPTEFHLSGMSALKTSQLVKELPVLESTAKPRVAKKITKKRPADVPVTAIEVDVPVKAEDDQITLSAKLLTGEEAELAQEAVAVLMKTTGLPREVVIYALIGHSGAIKDAYSYLIGNSEEVAWRIMDDLAILTRDAEKVVSLLSCKSTEDITARFEFLNRLCDAP